MPNDISDVRHDAAQRTLPNSAALRLRLGRARLHAEASFSTGGLLALGGLLAATLLSTAVIVAVATRKLPAGAMPAGMKRRR